MSLLSIPQITKGTPATITLDKAALFTLAPVAADSFFSIESNVAKCIIKFVSGAASASSGVIIQPEVEIIIFDLTQETPSAEFLVSVNARNEFSVNEIILVDFDGGAMVITGTNIPSGLDINLNITPFPPPSFTGVSLLMDMEGSNIEDKSSLTNALTVSGNTALSTEQFKSGTQSLKINGGYVETPTTVGNFGTSDFTVEGWFYIESYTGAYQCLFSKTGPNNDQGYALLIDPNSTQLQFLASNSTSWTWYFLADPLSTSQWHHIAVVREGDVIKLYVDGTSVASTSGVTSIWSNTNEGVIIGNYGHSGLGSNVIPLNGYVDDFKITEGQAVYTSDFIPV